MKKKILLTIVLIMTLLLKTSNVYAKVISKNEIENNSYVIGNYYFTRTPNATNNYEGKLTTQEIMLAAGTIDGDLNDMTIYYKNFLGNWIDGLTGEEITVPSTFEINNRNLKDIIPTPELNCLFNYFSGGVAYPKCSTYVNVNGQFNYLYSNKNSLHGIDGRELYLLKRNDDSLPTSLAVYDVNTGNFKADSQILKLELFSDDLSYSGDKPPLYQIVSRFYYLDGTEKIYSEYSNIETNGGYVNFDLSHSSIKVNATINEDYAVKVNSSLGSFGTGLNGEVNYYNVKFNISDVPDGYIVRNYKIYSPVPADESLNFEYYSYIQNAENGSDTLEYLYMESLAKKKYIDAVRFYGGSVNMYLIAEADGVDAFGDYHDVSSISAYSKKLYLPTEEENESTRGILGRVTICRENSSECYIVNTSSSMVTAN